MKEQIEYVKSRMEYHNVDVIEIHTGKLSAEQRVSFSEHFKIVPKPFGYTKFSNK